MQGACVQNRVAPVDDSVLCATFAIAFVSACKTSGFVTPLTLAIVFPVSGHTIVPCAYDTIAFDDQCTYLQVELA